LPSASQPLLLLAFLTYVLASPAYLYMPHLFTRCLPTIICVMLMFTAFHFLSFSYFLAEEKKGVCAVKTTCFNFLLSLRKLKKGVYFIP